MNDREAAGYDLEETQDFLDDIERLTGSIERWDDIKSTIDWALSTDPRIGHQIPETDVWALPLESRPLITTYYTFDDSRRVVTLHRAYRLAD